MPGANRIHELGEKSGNSLEPQRNIRILLTARQSYRQPDGYWRALHYAVLARSVNFMMAAISFAVPTVRYDSVLGSAIFDGRRTITIATISSVLVYLLLGTGSRSACFGSLAADGSFLDANGVVTSTAPACIQATLHPSLLMVALLVIVGATGRLRVRQRGTTAMQVARMTRYRTLATITITFVALVLSFVALFSLDLAAWQPGHIGVIPFPLNVEFAVRPQ